MSVIEPVSEPSMMSIDTSVLKRASTMAKSVLARVPSSHIKRPRPKSSRLSLVSAVLSGGGAVLSGGGETARPEPFAHSGPGTLMHFSSDAVDSFRDLAGLLVSTMLARDGTAMPDPEYENHVRRLAARAAVMRSLLQKTSPDVAEPAASLITKPGFSNETTSLLSMLSSLFEQRTTGIKLLHSLLLIRAQKWLQRATGLLQAKNARFLDACRAVEGACAGWADKQQAASAAALLTTAKKQKKLRLAWDALVSFLVSAKLVSDNEAQDLKKLPDNGQEIGGALYRRALHASDLLTAGAALALPDPKVLDLDDNDRALQSLYESLESLRERRRLLFAAGQTSRNVTERPTIDALRDIDTQMASLHARVREQITQRNIARTRFVSKNAGETPTESQKTTAQRLVQKFVQAAALERVSQSEAQLLQQHIADLADTEARRMTTEEYADHVADVASGFASSVANEVRAMNKAAAALSQRLGSAQTDVAYICNRLNEISRTATPSEKHAINQTLQKLYKNLGSQLTHDARQSYRKLFKLVVGTLDRIDLNKL